MKFKKSMILLVIAIFIFGVASVCANDVDDTILASEDTGQMELSASIEIAEDNLQISEKNNTLVQTNNEILGMENDLEVLGAFSSSYSDLAREINESGNITLKYKNYTYDDGATPINISENNKVIDGNGAVIDMEGSTIRAFMVSGYNVTIKNLTIKNANYTGNGSSIYFYSIGTLTNCNFIDNTATNYGGAIYFSNIGAVSNCNFINNTARYGGAIHFSNSGTVSNCNFINNTARYGGAIRFSTSGTVTDCNFTNNKVTIGVYSLGGAIYGSCTVSNCNFIANIAESGGAIDAGSCTVSNCNFIANIAESGGAIDAGSCTVSNCNFTNNAVTGGSGGAIHMEHGNVENCNFTNNAATGAGGAIWLLSGNVLNCNFTKNTATTGGIDDSGTGGAINVEFGRVENCNFNDNQAESKGGAVYFLSPCDQVFVVTNCNFTNNKANNGGAVYFESINGPDIVVTKCNFTNNTATGAGGAVYFESIDYPVSVLTNYNFIDNTATNGGAIWLLSGTVSNCYFTNNKANNGGAVYFKSINCPDIVVTKCNFIDNTATNGGAIWMSYGNVSNCNFAANTATNGGAIWMGYGNVSNCNFNNNNATSGSAIYLNLNEGTRIISNSTFLNNRANAKDLQVTKKENNIIITFTGNDNLLNAIYSNANVSFTNVTYWGVGGKTNTGNSLIVLSGSNREAGQNITVKGVVNDRIINTTEVTDENGEIVLGGADEYWVIFSHEGDSYYTEVAETLFTNMKLYANVTSITTNNKTVNITAKSNIYNEVMPGKLVFILPDGSEINANYGTNGTWWTVHAFDECGVYQINASYIGLDNVTINNGFINVTKTDSAIILDDIVLSYARSINVTVETEGAVRITASINGTNVPVINDYTIQFSDLAIGNYTLEVITIPDDDHISVSKTVKLTVNKATTEIKLTNETLDLKVNASVSDFAQLTPADAGTLNYTSSNGTVVKIEGSKIIAVGAGKANITVSFKGNDNYTAAEDKTIAVTVSLNDASVSAEDMELTLDKNATISYTTNPEGLNVTFVADNSGIVEVSDDGIVTPIKVGTAHITINVGDNETYALNSTVITVTVSKIPTKILIQNTTLTMEVDDVVDPVVSLMPSDAGNLSFKVSDESVILVNGFGVVTAVGEGNATVTVSFRGNDKYLPSNATITVTVSKVAFEPEITLNDTTLTVEVPENATGYVTLTVGNETLVAPIENGIATFDLSDVPDVDYNATITYGGDDKYEGFVYPISIETNFVLSAEDLIKYFHGPERFTVNLTDSKCNPIVNASVNITINGVDYDRKTNDKGQASIAINLNSGEYSVVVTYNGTSVDATVTVLPTVNGTDITKVFRNATQYFATFRDSRGNYLPEGTAVIFNINGVMYERKVSDDKGLAKLNINLNPGEYVITAMNPVTNEKTANNITVLSRITENADLTKYYRNASQYTVKVLGDDGKAVGAGENVTFNINGVLYTRQTDANGIAKLNINLQPGDYVITAEYKGCLVSNNIKVLPILNATNISMKYRDGTQFKATLVDGQGKAYAGQNVTFNINGVFYNRPTDGSGTASLNINLMPGEYIITSSYNGFSIANKITIKG